MSGWNQWADDARDSENLARIADALERTADAQELQALLAYNGAEGIGSHSVTVNFERIAVLRQRVRDGERDPD